MPVVEFAESAIIAEYTDTVGTGSYSLRGAITGCFRLRDRYNAGDTIDYFVTDGPNVEYTTGTFTTGDPDILSRDTINASSNGNAAVDWSGNTRPIIRVAATASSSGGSSSSCIWAPSISLAGPDEGGRFPNAGEELFAIQLVFTASLPADLFGSYGSCTHTPLADAVFHLIKNGSPIGTMTFAAGSTTAAFSFASTVNFSGGDIFSLTAPDPQDDNLSDFRATFRGTITT